MILELGALVRRTRGAFAGTVGTVLGFGSLAAAIPEHPTSAPGAFVVRIDFDGIERTLAPDEVEVVR